MALFRDVLSMFFGERTAEKMCGPDPQPEADPGNPFRVTQRGNIVGGDMAGGNIIKSDGDLRIRAQSIQGGSIRSGSLSTRNIRCKGDLCISNGELSISGTTYRLDEDTEGTPRLLIDGVPYKPWDPFAPTSGASERNPYSPWSGEVNGHRIVVGPDTLTVDGTEYHKA